jgi:PRTRC genetic system protein F
LPRLHRDIPSQLDFREGSDNLGDYGIALAKAGVLKPVHWKEEKQSLPDAIKAAMLAWAKPLTGNLRVLNLAMHYSDNINRHDFAWLDEEQDLQKHGGSGFVFTMSDDRICVNVGSTVSQMEEAVPGLGKHFWKLLNIVNSHGIMGFTPQIALGSAQACYWMGENDELMVLGEYMENSKQAQALQKAIKDKTPTRDLCPELEIFRRHQWDDYFAAKGGQWIYHPQDVKGDSVDFLRNAFRKTINPRFRRAVTAAIEGAVICRSLNRGRLIHNPPMEICGPAIIRWAKDDPIDHIFDTEYNGHFECGEYPMDLIGYMPFHIRDHNSVRHALEKTQTWLKLAALMDIMLFNLSTIG